ncbi:hypothetical protein QQF64_003543 [Cirrhinus molitorella]|uniref:Uncharacterized protein n=1 Tax=Cirrhinus molitorella TaxID=172907 RepID=A0ABR3MLL6_9TELE
MCAQGQYEVERKGFIGGGRSSSSESVKSSPTSSHILWALHSTTHPLPSPSYIVCSINGNFPDLSQTA